MKQNYTKNFRRKYNYDNKNGYLIKNFVADYYYVWDKGKLQRIGTFVIYPVDPGFCRM